MKIKRLEGPSDTFDIRFPAGKRFDLVGFGTNSVDHVCVAPEYPAPGSKTRVLQYEMLPGGQVATAIAFLSEMGMKTKYVGKMGGDKLGQFCMKSFASGKVDTSSVRINKSVRNQYAFIVIDGNSGERTVLSGRDPGLDFRESELDREVICAGRMLHLDGYDSGSLRAAAWCQEAEIPVMIDLDTVVPNCRELIGNIDFLIVSSNFPAEYTGIPDRVRAFEALYRSYDGFLAVTLGASGAMTWIGDHCVTFPALKLDAVDTTGAGDVFHAGFIYGLLQNWPLERIMRFSNAAAGLSCLYLGARSGIRPISEILQHAETLRQED
jgi:sulfofructose kinase